MQFTRHNSDAIRAGQVTVSFRNWRRRHATVGGVYRLRPDGAVRVTDIAAVCLRDVAAADAARWLRVGGCLGGVLGTPARGNGCQSRVRARRRRAACAATDRRSAAPWTAKALVLIRANPAVRAGDLAPVFGWPTPKFKANVRKLRALGLTQSLETGYRLTDLGERIAATLATGAAADQAVASPMAGS